MSEAQDRLLYLGVGPLAAVTLGVALVPVRGLTTASIAFVGLAGCGILAAALASDRGRGVRRVSGKQVAVLQSALAELPQAGPLESRLARILEAVRASFPLAAAAVRDRTNRIVAASAHAHARAVPSETLDPEAFDPPRLSGREDVSLPSGGVRLALVVEKRPVGWLDLWGDGRPASQESRQMLAAVARALAALLTDAER